MDDHPDVNAFEDFEPFATLLVEESLEAMTRTIITLESIAAAAEHLARQGAQQLGFMRWHTLSLQANQCRLGADILRRAMRRSQISEESFQATQASINKERSMLAYLEKEFGNG